MPVVAALVLLVLVLACASFIGRLFDRAEKRRDATKKARELTCDDVLILYKDGHAKTASISPAEMANRQSR